MLLNTQRGCMLCLMPEQQSAGSLCAKPLYPDFAQSQPICCGLAAVLEDQTMQCQAQHHKAHALPVAHVLVECQ